MSMSNHPVPPTQARSARPSRSTNAVSHPVSVPARHHTQAMDERFHALTELCTDGVLLVRASRIAHANAAAARLLGCADPQQLLGRPLHDILPDETGQELRDDTGTRALRRFDGAITTLEVTIVPGTARQDADERIVLLRGAASLPDSVRMEKERDELLTRERAARIQAETAARARDEFLAVVSHELRAPLNAIQSWAHVLENYVKEATSAPLAQRALQGIRTGVGQQVRLIEDLLDVTRMLSGRLRLVKQPMALLPVIEAALESVRGMAAAKHISIATSLRIGSEQIDGDPDRVQQIFWNLLSNAVKFTSDYGHIWLDACRIDEQICVTVRDDGIGIAPDFLPHLFNRFSQEDSSSTRSHTGLGLGLFLVRHLVELHGGRVEASSRGEGQGAAFSVRLPLHSAREKYIPAIRTGDSPGDMPLPSLEGCRVLLIDDQEEARESLTMVLAAAGAEVFAAGSAKEALDWLSTLDKSEYPTVLVCDIAMPGEDGYAVLRRIRAWNVEGGRPLQRLPALALTAFAQREDRIRALTAGFQMHVTKPVAPEELIVVIATVLERS
jgi:signal transduction histidine kinase/ActR/RegA family two-component response regulator